MSVGLEELAIDSWDEDSLTASICKTSFEYFVKTFWPYVPGAGNMVWSWHMTYICEELQIIAERVFNNQPKEYDLLINISPGTSKPVWEEMPVLMASGVYKRLKNIKVDDLVIGKSGKPCKVLAVHKQGKLPCVSIHTNGGRDIVTAEDHPILTADGWQEASTIRPEQMLALMHKPELIHAPDRSVDEFKVAGYFIGDGSVTGLNCSLTNKEPTYIEDFVACCDRLGWDVYVRKAKNGVTILSPKRRKGESNIGKYKGMGRGCQVLEGPRKWLRDIGIQGLSSRTKKIPSFVWKGTDEQIKGFIAAYFHCDGCVSYKHGNKRNISVSVCTISIKLAKGLQRLLLRLGISMNVRKHVSKNGFSYNRNLKNYVYYTICTSDQDVASRFLELIPLLGPKQKKLEGFAPHRRTFQQSYWPDRVETNESVGELPCRCLTVEGDESFVVDGVVVHNSTLCSILFPAWTWTRMPHARHITASHTDTLVLDLATKSRYVIESGLYKQLFPYIQLRKDQATKGYYANTLGGDRVSCTVGGKSPIGFHGHFLSWDDPIDPQKAMSEVEIQNAADFAPHVLFTRKVDKEVSVFYGIMQRLHPQDPSGRLLKDAKEKEDAAPIRHICLPAELADNVHPPELREKYIDGLMDPVRLSRKALKPYKANAYSYAGQFLQCLVGDSLITTRRGSVPIDSVVVGDFVLTRDGFRKVLWSGQTGYATDLRTVIFSNGNTITGTPNHPVWTVNRGWVSLDSLQWGDYATTVAQYSGELSWEESQQKQLNLLNSTVNFTHVRSVENTLKAVNQEGTTYIETCGDTTMGISPLVTLSITRTKTQVTIALIIWKLLPYVSMVSIMQTIQKSVESILTPYEKTLRYGTKLKLVKSIIRNMVENASINIGKRQSINLTYVLIAKRNSCHDVI